MSVQIEKVSSIERKLSFTVPASNVGKELDSALRNLGRDAVLRGFRKGKVPVQILEQRYGRQLRAEVAATLINDSLKDAASDMEFFGQPSVEKGDLKRGQDFTFAVVLQVKPELEIASKIVRAEIVNHPQHEQDGASADPRERKRAACVLQ